MTTTAPQPVDNPLTLTEIEAAVKAALVTRGKRRGTLLARCPDNRTDAAPAWQAITATANPYKLGLWACMSFSPRQRAIFDTVDGLITRQRLDVRHLDRDRKALDDLGVW